MKKYIGMLAFLLMGMHITLAQTTIRGKIADNKNGDAIVGASIAVKGTTTGTISSIDGTYSITAPSNESILVFSFIGFATQEEPVSGRSMINISLEEDLVGLEEIVVVGYGTIRKSDATGATSALTSDDFNTGANVSPEQMIRGRVSGVQITQTNGEPGAGMNIKIRGSSSIRAGNTPLYVVDGVPLHNASSTPEGVNIGGVNAPVDKNPLNFINPQDIERIDILKDASATAIYGSRGANGVVLVTTKKGTTRQATISYNASYGIDNIRENMPVLSAEEFAEKNKALGGDADKGERHSWQDEVFRTAYTQQHNLSMSGGTDKGSYLTSIGYTNQEGIIKNSDLEKLVGRLNLSQKYLNDRLLVETNLTYSKLEDNRAMIGGGGGAEGDLLTATLVFNPTQPIRNEDGTYNQPSDFERNPIPMLELYGDNTITNRTLANTQFTFDLKDAVEGLKFKINTGIDNTAATRRVEFKKDFLGTPKGRAGIAGLESNNRLLETYFNYDKTLNKIHTIGFLLGYSYQDFLLKEHSVQRQGYTKSSFDYTYNFGASISSPEDPTSSAEYSELQSYFSRLTYSLMGKYMLTATSRSDGSSKFGDNNKYGYFPSIGLGWNIHKEDFLKNSELISALKLRLGWGKTGNQEIPNKISQGTLGQNALARYINSDGEVVSGFIYNRTPNPGIQWESTTQYNTGIDISLLKGRFNATLDYFYKETVDFLFSVNAKSLSPTSNQWKNIDGNIINSGVEFALDGVAISNKDFSLSLGGNITYLTDEVKGLPVDLIETGLAQGPGLSDTRVQIITNGQSLHTFYVPEFLGYDANGTSIYSEDPVYAGSANPNLIYGFNSNLRYKNIDLTIALDGVSGNKIYNNTAVAYFNTTSLASGTNIAYYDENQNASDPVTSSTKFIEDGSFLRLSTINLGYNFDVSKLKAINNARIYVAANNFWVFTKYTGFDPEVNINQAHNDVPSQGIDYAAYPRAKSLLFGLSISFK